jgi:hypothetical protein
MLSINETRSRGGRNGDQQDVEKDTPTFVIHFAKILLAPTFRASWQQTRLPCERSLIVMAVEIVVETAHASSDFRAEVSPPGVP